MSDVLCVNLRKAASIMACNGFRDFEDVMNQLSKLEQPSKGYYRITDVSGLRPSKEARS